MHLLKQFQILFKKNNTTLNLTVTLDNSSYVIERIYTVYMNFELVVGLHQNEEYFSSIFQNILD